MSYYNFPAGSEGQIETNTETGEKFIYDSDVGAWLPYRGDVDEFVNVTGDTMTGDLHLPNVDVDDTVFINEGELNADSAAVGGLEPEDFLMTPVGSTNTPYSVSTSPNGQYVLYQSWGDFSMLSSDGGETFVKLARKPGTRQGAGAVDDTGKIYLGESAYIWSSEDQGENWTRVSPYAGQNIVSIHILSYNQDIVIGYTYNRDFIVSQDRGATWSATFRSDNIFGESPNAPKNYVDHDGVTYFYGTYGHVATTSDGLNWTDISSTYGGGTIKGEVGSSGPLSLRRIGGKWVIIGYHNSNATDNEARVWVGGSNITDPFVQATGTNAPRKEGGGYAKESHVFGDGIILLGYDDRYFISEDLGETWGEKPLFTLTQGNNANYNVRAASNNKYLFAITGGTNAPTSPILRSPIPNGDEQYLYWNGDILATVQQVKDGFEGLVDLIQEGESNQISVLEGYVQKSGDSMEGHLTVLDPINLRDAVNVRYLQTQTDLLDDELDTKVDRAGDSMDGPLILHRQPQEAMEAAPKQYVDQKVFDALNGADSALDSAELRSLFVAKEGDSMSGALYSPKFQVGPDGDNENKAIYYFDPDGDAVHELEAVEGGGTDMDAWLDYHGPFDEWRPECIEIADGLFVAAAYQGMFYSYNAIDWHHASGSVVPQDYLDFQGIHYANNRWVAVARSGAGPKIAYSDNGTTWQFANVPDTASRGWNDVTYGNGMWVAVSMYRTNQCIYSTDGINWTETSMPGDGSWQWHRVEYGSGRFVAIALNNYIAWSEDGINWTKVHESMVLPSAPGSLGRITYGNGRFVVTNTEKSYSSVWYTSVDGIGWSPINDPSGILQGSLAIAYSGDMFVAIVNNTYAVWSMDGINWEATGRYPGGGLQSNYWWDMEYGNGKFVAVAGSGKEGVKIAILEHKTDRSGLYYDGELIATEVNLEPLFEKVNHLSQEIGGTGDLDSEGLRGYLDENFVSRAGDSMTGALQLPGDPTQPLHAATKQYVDSAVNNLTFDSNTIDDLIAEVIDSDDLVHVAGDTMTGFLTLHAHPLEDYHAATKAYVHQVLVDAVDSSSGGISVDSGMLMDTFVLSAGDSMTGQLVAPSFKTGPDAANDGKSILYMEPEGGSVHELEAREGGGTDMDAWIGYSSANESADWKSVTYGNGKFVAVSEIADQNTSRIMYSTDGIDWLPAAAGSGSGWQAVTYGDGKFVAVGTGGGNRASYSTDGINWTIVPSSNDSNGWNSVAYGAGKFVAVASGGSNRAMYSTDGINWTGVPSGNESNWWSSVTYGDGKFVAVANATGTNRAMYSTDGINWTGVPSANDSNAWWSVTYDNGKFVAVAYSGTNRVMYSEDGINWTAVSGYDSNSWRSVTYGDGKFVAVANNGTNRVMYSEDGINWTSVPSANESNSWFSVTYGNGKFVAVALAGTNRVMVLDAPEGRTGLYYDGELIATEVNLKPLFDKVNDLSQGGGVVTDSDLAALELDDLNDVSVPSPNVGDTLVWNGSHWEAQEPSGGAVLAYQDLAPASPENGDLWFNTSTLKLSVYHGNAWVQIGA